MNSRAGQAGVKRVGGRVVHRDILEEIYSEINERYGSNARVPE